MKWLRDILKDTLRGDRFTTREKLSFIYVFFSVNACMLVGYAASQGKFDLAEYHGLKTEEERTASSGLQIAKALKMPNATVIRYSGFKQIERIKIEDGVPITVSKNNDE